MVFNSVVFLFCFLPLALLAYYLVPGRGKNVVLLVESLLFYCWTGVEYLPLIVCLIVTNDQADCGLVFVAQAKPGKAADVESELQAYKDSLSANDLYAEFADKVALAKDARIVANGDYVAIVIAGISNPDYSAIDTALETALNF